MQKLPHRESIGDKWASLIPAGEKEISGVITRIIAEGGTRPAWKHIADEKETILMAYPQESTLRASVTLSGEVEGKLEPITVMPLLEGIDNRLLVVETHEWHTKVEGEVLVLFPPLEKALWFYDPLFFRDKADLKFEEVCDFRLAGLVLNLEKAMLDEMTLTKGEAYEKHSMQFLADNPDKSRLDVPPLKISLAGQQVIALGQHISEYKARVQINNLQSFDFGPEGAKKKIYSFIVNLGTQESPLPVPLYASETACRLKEELKDGMDVDIYFWLQGRISD